VDNAPTIRSGQLLFRFWLWLVAGRDCHPNHLRFLG
jgi:hypothetical protein